MDGRRPPDPQDARGGPADRAAVPRHVEDTDLLYDRDEFFATVLRRLRERRQALGLRAVTNRELAGGQLRQALEDAEFVVHRCARVPGH